MLRVYCAGTEIPALPDHQVSTFGALERSCHAAASRQPPFKHNAADTGADSAAQCAQKIDGARPLRDQVLVQPCPPE